MAQTKEYIYLFIHSFIHSFIHLFIHPSIHSSIHSFNIKPPTELSSGLTERDLFQTDCESGERLNLNPLFFFFVWTLSIYIPVSFIKTSRKIGEYSPVCY